MNTAWIFCGVGFIFCLGGAWLFANEVMKEEDRKISSPILVMVAGIILIGIGTAKYLHLMP
jgi:hypothetical protein